MEFNKFDKVKVSTTATGLGDWLDGWIDDIYEFAGKIFVSVRYNKPTIYGDSGIVLTNLGLLKKIDSL